MSEAMEERPTKRLKISGDEVLSTFSDPAVIAVIEREQKLGISACVTEQLTPVTGVVKQRYTDFLVNEVTPDGNVLHLQKTTYDRAGQNTKTQNGTASNDPGPKASNGDENEATPTETTDSDDTSTQSAISAEDRKKLVGYLGETAVGEILALFASIKEHPKKRSRDHPIVNTPFTSDRMVRTEIHQAIRNIFHSRIDSSTNKDGLLVLSAANPNFRNNHQSRVGKLSWIERGGEHCHFTLYKEMKDTMESLSFLAYLLKKNARDFQIAGTKDRRAATVQRVSVWRVEAERLAALNKNPTMRNATLGDFEYHPSGLQLGDLSGNEFTITVRDVQLVGGKTDDVSRVQAALEASLSSLQTNGFLNYYGLQRFGTFAISSDVLGLQILKGDFEAACNSILDYNAASLADGADVGRDDRDRARAIKIFRDTNSMRDAMDVMPKRWSAESSIIRALGRNPNDHLGALMTLQRNMRQMYVHAYQSLIWNKAATNRWKVYGNKVMEGDLVLVTEHKDKDTSSTSIADGPSEGIDPEGEVIIHPAGDDRARSQHPANKNDAFERARPLTATEASSGAYSIFDIVLPLPGFDIIYPENASGGEFYKQVMGEDGLDPYDMRRSQKDFSLSGSYRKVMARIAKSYTVDVRTYTDDNEQFVDTDREKLFGRREDGRKKNVEAGEEAGQQESDTQQNAQSAEISEDKEVKRMKTAAILKLQLGTSQYATMALREISRGGLVEYKPGFSGGR
ncbi:Multisubstrate pseudouridine synthase 7 [Cyphellophora attinorum]|uniref:Multisubstrate pseudouridine synthase 7 n=1 Tax=Cyphellophora attinorum TaxID=1664694 RepID=A0A0N0NQL3_9EURO|nr:Multisubstrate pseudouridine synthase 7 [Phialophora attinorum]KPI44041.1 Multisubstrate pseudouridine synthase 7 [Phialophora attinorum]